VTTSVVYWVPLDQAAAVAAKAARATTEICILMVVVWYYLLLKVIKRWERLRSEVDVG